MEMVNSFKKYLLATIPYIVVKNNVEAEEYETIESRRDSDLFIAASLETDTFVSYVNYPAGIYRQGGIIDEELIKLCLKDKRHTPDAYRQNIVRQMRKYVISTYVEKNDYYRKLAGLPKLDQEPLYLSKMDLERHGYYPEDRGWVSLDQLPNEVLIAMEGSGFLFELAEQFPDHEYIPYLGNRRVGIIEARRAGHFELLYFPKQEVAYRFYRDFLTCYDEARVYFLSVVFNYDYVNIVEYYNEFIGFLILHMAIQRMINTMFKVMVDRDFYDLDTVRVFLSSYQIPFVELFTMDQQKMLVKNLNILLRNKGNTKVLYDILGLLGYDNFEILKYLLVKQHKLYQENDESPLKPLFVYRTSVTEDGTLYIEPDSSQMYEYYFVGIPMDEDDPIIPGDKTDGVYYDYSIFTNGDPTWIEDDKLVGLLEDMQKNYIEKKYANINLNFKMQQITFELVYLAGIIIDRKIQTDKIMLDFALLTEKQVSLYEIQILLICLMCKRNQMEPDILKNPSQILYIQGFNFEEDINKIKEDVMKRPDLFDPEIVNYIKTIIFTTPNDVNEMYRTVKRLDEFLTEAMQTTQDIDAYHAYRHLYNTLMITRYQQEVYTLKDGTMPNQFTEILNDEHPDLFHYYESITTPEKCIDVINYISLKLSTMFADTEYLSYLNPIDTYVVESILTILRAFKSLTIDIRSIDIYYLFDSRLHNMMRMIDQAKMEVTINPEEHEQPYEDFPMLFVGNLDINERDAFYLDRFYIEGSIQQFEDTLYFDKVSMDGDIFVGEQEDSLYFADSFSMDNDIRYDENQPSVDHVKMRWEDENDWKTVQ